MPTLPEISAALSYEQLLAHFHDLADYDLVGSVARARLFIHAGRILTAPGLVRSSQASRGEEVEFNPLTIQAQVDQALRWLSARLRTQQGERELGVDPAWRDV
jgi:hypothetical protein